MVAAFIDHGSARPGTVLQEMVAWMEAHEYESMDQMWGSIGLSRSVDPSDEERAGCQQVRNGWN